MAIGEAAATLTQTVKQLQALGWTTVADLFTRGPAEIASVQEGILNGRPLTGNTYFKATDLTTGFVQRGWLPGSGQFINVPLAPNNLYEVSYLDPATLFTGTTVFRSNPGGTPTVIPQAVLAASLFPDSDGDGLPDDAEDILGTDPHKFSTSGDGISDLAKLQQGLDLLSNVAFPRGIVASLTFPGAGRNVVLTGSTTDPQGQTAYVAASTGGLAIVDASNFRKPVLLGQLPLSGDANDVAVDARLQIAAVADSGGGLVLVNVADPTNPTVLHTIPVTTDQVEVADGVAYVAVGGCFQAYDMFSGESLGSLSLTNGLITGLAREGPMLYTMDSGLTLRVIDISGATMVARGSLSLPQGVGPLFVGDGVAYVSAGFGTTGGFITANVSNPDAPTLISGTPDTSTQARALAANGSGLLVSVGTLPLPKGFSLDVTNVSDPTNTGDLVASLPNLRDPRGVALASGIAFVADTFLRLAVYNYLAFDTNGVAPDHLHRQLRRRLGRRHARGPGAGRQRVADPCRRQRRRAGPQRRVAGQRFGYAHRRRPGGAERRVVPLRLVGRGPGHDGHTGDGHCPGPRHRHRRQRGAL